MLKRVYDFFGSEESADLESSNCQGYERAQDDITQVSSFSWDLRLQCFLGCFCLSLICSLAGSALLFSWKITGFTVMVSLGSILSLFGTCFLMGPLKQLKKMFEQGRFLASVMYLLSIVFTLISGIVLSNPPLALISVIGQYIAVVWYSLTYIPFAQHMIWSLCCRCFR
ncbi:unnamed protein product [Thelazia callipaeda]|uniref:Vesicle transport protein n=1 Tax=Thelazia callipaeda TaxID=103827 RepID=A0A0N5CY82_THECL|nr:unnamed protein product [Thelazia callipaeda]